MPKSLLKQSRPSLVPSTRPESGCEKTAQNEADGKHSLGGSQRPADVQRGHRRYLLPGNVKIDFYGRHGALLPGSIGNRSVVSLIAFLLKLEANRSRCHQLPEYQGRNGLMGISLIEPLVLKEER
ncbi:hypothetical protein [Rhizobium vallis]|nr:hypothetical protein [Rhizobium vallis]